jgi:hypothetical protein
VNDTPSKAQKITFTIEADTISDLYAQLRAFVNTSEEEPEEEPIVYTGKRGRPLRSKSQKSGKPRAKLGTGTTAKTKELYLAGFFDEPRTAADVKVELIKHDVDPKQVYAALQYLEKGKFLVKNKLEGTDNFAYVKAD